MVLFVNACARSHSRTKRLADHLIQGLNAAVQEIDLLSLRLPAVDEAFLQKREAAINDHDYSDPMFDLAKQFAAAEDIVVAAPYWDLSFPATVKAYFEQITVTGLTFSYGADGRPVGHCGAKRLFYVMTAGGPILPPNHGYAYVRDLAKQFYGIPEILLFSAEMLDVDGFDAETILADAMQRVNAYFNEKR